MNFCLYCGIPVKNKYCSISHQNKHQNRDRFLGRKLKRNRRECSLCNRLISLSNFERHKCSRIKLRLTKEERSVKHLGNRSNTGRKLPIEQCRKISFSLKGKMVGDKNPAKRKEVREKISASVSKNHNGGYRTVPYFKYKLSDGKEIKLRGSYEVKFATFLDDNGINWIYQKPIAYLDCGIKRNLLPDFYISTLDTYFETKGYFTDESKRKIQLVNEQTDKRIVLIFWNDLDQMKDGIEWLKTKRDAGYPSLVKGSDSYSDIQQFKSAPRYQIMGKE